MINAEFEAEELVKNFELEIPINPKKVCDLLSTSTLKIEYREEKIESNDICGMSIANGSTVVIVVNSNIKNPARRLFTAAHELGHVLLHIQNGKKVDCRCAMQDIFRANQKNIEAEANQFASSLLMPRHLIERKIHSNDLTWPLVKELSLHYSVSLEAAARRVVNLSKDMCALIIHDEKFKCVPIMSNSFPCSIQKLSFPKYLFFSTYEKDNIDSELEECDLSDWGLNLNKNQYHCYYSSLSFEKYQRIMTFLLLEESEDSETY